MGKIWKPEQIGNLISITSHLKWSLFLCFGFTVVESWVMIPRLFVVSKKQPVLPEVKKLRSGCCEELSAGELHLMPLMQQGSWRIYIVQTVIIYDQFSQGQIWIKDCILLPQRSTVTANQGPWPRLYAFFKIGFIAQLNCLHQHN